MPLYAPSGAGWHARVRIPFAEPPDRLRTGVQRLAAAWSGL